MAMVDDPEWLLSHIRHSFITSDDTGMCEMVIQDNDLLTLDQHRKRLREKQANVVSEKISSGSCGKVSGARMTSSSGNTPDDESSPRAALSPSPDIMSGWDFGIRRRSNTAQKLERIRKERQNRVKIKTVHWKDLPETFMDEDLDTLFIKKQPVLLQNGVETEETAPESNVDGSDMNQVADKMEALKMNEKSIPVVVNASNLRQGFNLESNVTSNETIKYPSKKISQSVLTEQLSKAVDIVSNPFKEYSKFDGRGHEGSTHTQRINMFVWLYGESLPTKPMQVVILSAGAKIIDLIGLSCWQYVTLNLTPALKRTEVQGFSLHIAEDDGEVDYGFPALENNEPVTKFSFPTLALVEKHQVGDNASDDGKFRESVFVRVNDYAGFSLIQVEDLNVTMGEVLKKAIKRRKGNKYAGKYVLEFMEKPGVCVEEEQSLDSTGAMEFYMLREHSARSTNVEHSTQKSSGNTSSETKSTPARVHFANRLNS